MAGLAGRGTGGREAQLKALPAPYPSEGMICWPVSARVGNVKNNDPSLVEPINLP
jgi:putative SOS response-associated peptidase YedK